MKKPTYKRGDAAAYYAWLEHQEGPVYNLAARFRPWEIYKLQGRDTYVRVVEYEADEKVELLQVETLDEQRFVIPVVPHQIDLWGVLGFEEPPVEQDAA